MSFNQFGDAYEIWRANAARVSEDLQSALTTVPPGALRKDGKASQP